jgi:carbamate kinase
MDKHSTDLRRMPPSPALQQIIDSKMIRQLARRMMLSASKC